MRILVLSDSHGNTGNMLRAVEKSAPTHIIHLGDCVRDTEALELSYPSIPLYRVRGNCDPGSPMPEYGLEEFDGVRIYFAHGHMQHVKFGLNSFCNSVHFSGAQLGLYGHTHQARWKQLGSLETLNPGSIGAYDRPTYGVVEIHNGTFSCRIYDLEEEK